MNSCRPLGELLASLAPCSTNGLHGPTKTGGLRRHLFQFRKAGHRQPEVEGGRTEQADFVVALRSGWERVSAECVDLRGRLDAAIGHDLLNRFQSCFDALHLSAKLYGTFGGLLGDQPTHFLFVLKPPPEPDPNHREKRNPEDGFHQQRFLEGEDVDDAVIHINLLTGRRNIARCGDAIQ